MKLASGVIFPEHDNPGLSCPFLKKFTCFDISYYFRMICTEADTDGDDGDGADAPSTLPSGKKEP